MEIVSAAWPTSLALPDGNAMLHCGGGQRSMSSRGGGTGDAAVVVTAGIRAAGTLDSGWAAADSLDSRAMAHCAGTSSSMDCFSSATSWSFEVRMELFSG